jgi:hypothetical protein
VATDPLGDFPVAFALVGANDQDHMRRFLQNLKNWGFLPRVVVTDGSNLYPKLLAELWPHAQHQLCVFHVLKDLNGCVLDALRRLRRRLAAAGKPKRRRGRLSKAYKRARAGSQAASKEQAYFVWKHRHLLVTRPKGLSGHGRRNLSRMFVALPELRTLRRFVLAVYGLFDPEVSYMEKVRYKWRRRRTIVRFVVLAVDRWWKKRSKNHEAQLTTMLNEEGTLILPKAAQSRG